MYSIYKATSPSGKVYIGQTKLKLKDRKNSHHSYARRKAESIFHKAILKYNFNFIWEVIEIANTKEEIDFLEKYYIKWFNSTDRNFGYNMDAGGFGGCLMSEEGKKRYKKKMQLYWNDPEYLKLCSDRFYKNKDKIQKARALESKTEKARIRASRNAGGGPFICNETKEIFQTQVEAANKFNCNKNTINRILKGKYKKLFKQYTFSYVEEKK